MRLRPTLRVLGRHLINARNEGRSRRHVDARGEQTPDAAANGLLRKRAQTPFGALPADARTGPANRYEHRDWRQRAEANRNSQNGSVQLCKPEVTGSIAVRSTGKRLSPRCAADWRTNWRPRSEFLQIDMFL